MSVTHIVKVVGAVVEVPVSVLVFAEGQRRRGAVSLIDDPESVWTLSEVVVDDHILIRLYDKSKKTSKGWCDICYCLLLLL